MATRNQFGYLFSDNEGVVRLVGDVLPYVAAFQVADGWAQRFVLRTLLGRASLETDAGLFFLFSCGGVLRGMGKQHVGAGVNLVAYYILALPLGIACVNSSPFSHRFLTNFKSTDSHFAHHWVWQDSGSASVWPYSSSASASTSSSSSRTGTSRWKRARRGWTTEVPCQRLLRKYISLPKVRFGLDNHALSLPCPPGPTSKPASLCPTFSGACRITYEGNNPLHHGGNLMHSLAPYTVYNLSLRKFESNLSLRKFESSAHSRRRAPQGKRRARP